MPNRVRRQTVEIRNQTINELKRIYRAEWHEISADIEKLVDEMYLDPEESTQAERIKHAEKDGNKDRLVALIVAAAILANTKAIKRINSGMDKIYNINADDVADYVLKKTGLKLIVKDVQVPSLLGKYTKRRYNKATDSKYVKREVMQEITDMLTKGKGTRQISKRLEKVYNFNRASAFRTTLTETTRIQSRGRLDVMQEAEKKGLAFKKIWRHGVHVAAPRDWHVAMEGEIRDLDKAFSNGLQMPGQEGAPAEEVINCHCWLDEELISN